MDLSVYGCSVRTKERERVDKDRETTESDERYKRDPPLGKLGVFTHPPFFLFFFLVFTILPFSDYSAAASFSLVLT